MKRILLFFLLLITCLGYSQKLVHINRNLPDMSAYQTITGMSTYAPLNNPTFTGTVTATTINATTVNAALVGNVTGHASSDALTNQTMYIGTTSHAINRTSLAESLTGITSIDGTSAGLTSQYIDWNQTVGGYSIANKPNLNLYALLTGATFSGVVTATTFAGNATSATNASTVTNGLYKTDVVCFAGCGVDSTKQVTTGKNHIPATGYSPGYVTDFIVCTPIGDFVNCTLKFYSGLNQNSTGTSMITTPTAITATSTVTVFSSIDNPTVAVGNAIWVAVTAVTIPCARIAVQFYGHKQ